MAGKPPFFNQPPGTGLLHASQINNMRVLAKQTHAANRPRQPVPNRRQSTVAIPVPGSPAPAGITLSTSNPVAETAGATATPGVTGLAADAGHVHAAAIGTPVAIGNANAAGASGNFADAAHVHALAGTVGGDLAGTLPNPTVKAITETSGPSDLVIGTITDGQYLKRSGGALVSGVPSGTATPPFPAWTSSAYTYAIGTPIVVSGSDGNLYRLVASSTNNDPTADSGTHWELFVLRYSITLNCGAGQRFAGSITDPAGIQQAINFIANCVGAASPSTATITIQIANNGTFTIATGSSTTSFTSAALLNVGTTLLYLSGTAGNSGKSCRITAVSGSGPWTYTADNGGGSTGLSSTPALSDVFTVDYGYGTNQIAIKLPIIGPNVIISGSTSTTTVPLFFPAVTDGGTGGSFAASTIYVAYTYTWSAGGATQETQPGFVVSFLPTASHKITLGGFTLPTGATGCNVYISTTLNGALSTFKKQSSSFSVSGGVAAALTLSANNTSGSTPPTVNPVAAAYPSALSWASTLAIPAIKLSNTPGMQIENLYMYGNLNSTSVGAAIEAFECNGTKIGPNIVLSSFYNGVYFTACRIYSGTVQIDACNQVAYDAIEYTLMGFFGNCAAFGGQYGYVSQYTSQFIGVDYGIEDPGVIYQMVGYRNATAGFLCQWGSNMRIPTVTSNGQQTWNVGTTYSPSSGTNSNHDAWLEVS